MSPPPALELLVVGDVHETWDDVDARFVEGGDQDMVVFVGDLADENVAFIERLAALSCPKLVMLGNHDAWNASRTLELGRVRRSIEVLGEAHLGYGAAELAGGAWLIVGARPFSWGGPWGRTGAFYRRLYGIDNEVASAERIVAAARRRPEASLILVGHNGPTGLGDSRDAIFGRDFLDPPVDFGDPDFGLALQRLRERGRSIPLVLAGHMHSILRGGGLRQRRVSKDGTLHLNAAVVPRHVMTPIGTRRHFVRVRLENGHVAAAEDVWVDDHAAIAAREPLVASQ